MSWSNDTVQRYSPRRGQLQDVSKSEMAERLRERSSDAPADERKVASSEAAVRTIVACIDRTLGRHARQWRGETTSQPLISEQSSGVLLRPVGIA